MKIKNMLNTRVLLSLAAFSAMLLASVGQLHAGVMNIGFGNAIVGNLYAEDGFDFTRTGSGSWSTGSASGFSTNVLDMHDHGINNGNYITLTETNGSTFSLVDMQFRVQFSSEDPLRLTNDLGGTIDFNLTGNTNARSHAFDSSWNNLTWVKFDSAFDITIGNINIENAPVPEPASLAIFGMIGFLACGRRRKS